MVRADHQHNDNPVRQGALGILSEARMKIAEGEWIRGVSRAWGVRYGDSGVTITGGVGPSTPGAVECYCVGGALDQAGEDLRIASRLVADTPDWDSGLAFAGRALLAAAPDVGLYGNSVVSNNDRHLTNKQHALEWFDAATKRVSEGTVR